MDDTPATPPTPKPQRVTRQSPSRSRWLDRLLHKCGAEPRLASTAAARSIQQSANAADSTLGWKIREWLWREHSAIGAIGVFIAISLLIFNFCVGAALLIPVAPATSNDLAILGTVAQVAGGAFGTVITVVVFAIGLVSQRTDGTAMYTPFVARRYHVFVIAALAASICLVNTVGPLMGDWFGLISMKYLLFTNVVTIPVVIFTTLWLMCRVIEAAGGADLRSTIPVFRSAMNRLAAHDRVLSETTQQFVAAISKSPLKLDYFAGYSSTVKTDGRFFGPGQESLVIDVDLHVLGQIAELAKRFDNTVEFSLLAAPGLIGDKRGVLYLTTDCAKESVRPMSVSGDSTDSQPPTTIVTLEKVLGIDSVNELSSIANRLFRFGKRPESDTDLRQFFARAQADLERVALSGDSVTFKARMDDYRDLVGEWLAATGPTATMQRPGLFAYKEPRFVGPLEIDLANILRVSVRSGDFFTYKVAVDAVFGLISDANSHDAVNLYQEASGVLDFAFYLAMEKPEFRTQSRDLFDRRISLPLYERKSLRVTPTDSIEPRRNLKDERESAMRHAILGSLLSMIRRAVEAGETETANMLIDRMTHNAGIDDRHALGGQVAPQVDDGKSLVQYALIVIVGWCQHMIQEEHAQHVSAIAVIKHALRAMPPRHVLVGLWELYHGSQSPRSAVDERLRLSRWDLREDERRVGMVFTRLGGNDWITDGYWVAMLQARSPHDFELRNFFPAPPSRWLWKTAELEERLSRLQVAGSAEAQEAARKGVLELIRQRQRLGEAAVLRKIAQTPLSGRRKEDLCSHIIAGVAKHRKLPEMFRLYSVASPEAGLVPLPVRMLDEIPREDLLEITSGGGHYGEWIAKKVVGRESQQLFFSMERTLTNVDTPFSLKSAGEAVQSAVKVLANRGFRADLLILPPQARFAFALLGRPMWVQAPEEVADWGNGSKGVWEGLTVLRCPYANTSSAIVADSRALFGKAARWNTRPTIKFTDSSKTTNREFLSQVNEVGTGRLPDSADLRVKVVVSLRPIIGIADLNAACRLDVTKGDACFAMRLGDSLYHRAACSAIDGADHLMFSLSNRLDGEKNERTPCTLCKPEKWDHEARAIVPIDD